MRYVFFNEFEPGVLHEGRVDSSAGILAESGAHSPQEALEYLIANEKLLRPSIQEAVGTQEGVDTSGVRFRPPVSRPSKLLCAFANYREDGAWTAVPLDIFLESPAAIIGDGDTVVLPPVEVKLNIHRRDATRGGIVARGGRPLITVWQSWDALVAHRWPRGRGGPHLAHERPLARGHGAPPSAATDLAALGHLARTTRACTPARTQPVGVQ